MELDKGIKSEWLWHESFLYDPTALYKTFIVILVRREEGKYYKYIMQFSFDTSSVMHEVQLDKTTTPMDDFWIQEIKSITTYFNKQRTKKQVLAWLKMVKRAYEHDDDDARERLRELNEGYETFDGVLM